MQRAQRNKNAGALIERKLAILDRALGMDSVVQMGAGGNHWAPTGTAEYSRVLIQFSPNQKTK